MGWLHLSSTFAMCLITHMTDTHTHRHTHTRPEEAIRLQPTICDTHRQRFTYKCVHAVHGTPLACAASDNHSASCTTRQLQFQQISDSSLQSALKACPCMQCRSSPVHSRHVATLLPGMICRSKACNHQNSRIRRLSYFVSDSASTMYMATVNPMP